MKKIKDRIPEFEGFQYDEIRLLPYTITEEDVEIQMIKVTRKVTPLTVSGDVIPYQVKDLVRILKIDDLPGSIKTCLTQIETGRNNRKRKRKGYENRLHSSRKSGDDFAYGPDQRKAIN